MIISIDCDGVICAFQQSAQKIAESLWPGRELDPNHHKMGIVGKDRNAFWRAVDDVENFWQKIPPIMENVIALRNFVYNERGHTIYFVTSRRDTAGDPVAVQTRRWLSANGICAADNYIGVIPVKEPGLKAFVMADLGIQFSIDDLGTTVERCNEVKGHKAYLLDQPYNRDKNYGPRVFNLEQWFNVITGKRPEGYFLS